MEPKVPKELRIASRPRIHFVVTDSGTWLRFLSNKPKNWHLFDYDEARDLVKTHLLFNLGLKHDQCNLISAFLDSCYGIQIGFANIFFKLAKKMKDLDDREAYPGHMYVVRVPPSVTLGLPSSVKKLWPKCATSVSVCARFEDIVKYTKELDRSALPFLSELFPDAIN